MNTKHTILIGALAFCGFIHFATIGKAADSEAQRRAELSRVISALQRPGSEAEAYLENPGWHDSTNQAALLNLSTNSPGTDEGDIARIWLSVLNAEKISRPSEREQHKRSLTTDAGDLQSIITRSTNASIVRLAKFCRTEVLFPLEGWPSFEASVNEIVSQIDQYRSETNEQFLVLLKADRMTPSDIEPALLSQLMIKDCFLGHLDAALSQATSLKAKFPEWSKRQGIDGNIELLKQGKSPYRKL